MIPQSLDGPIPLPQYAPELNRMGNVWKYLRANKLSARIWDTYDQILTACAEAWNWFAADPNRIRSIGTRDCAAVNLSGRWYYHQPGYFLELA